MQLCAKTLRQLINERNETIVCEQMDDRKWRSACAQHTSVVFAVVSSTANERVVQQLLSALAHIHSMNIIHRDVTPNNVFVRDPRATIAVGGALANLHVLLGDFGLACEHQPAAGISDGNIEFF
jgi:serine/threonine protein kinase